MINNNTSQPGTGRNSKHECQAMRLCCSYYRLLFLSHDKKNMNEEFFSDAKRKLAKKRPRRRNLISQSKRSRACAKETS